MTLPLALSTRTPGAYVALFAQPQLGWFGSSMPAVMALVGCSMLVGLLPYHLLVVGMLQVQHVRPQL
jgi:hypothetical protein